MENTASALSGWVAILTACAPILISLIGIIPTVVANRKKTQKSIDDMQTKLIEDINQTKTAVKNVQTKLDAHLMEEEEHRAKQARYRILRFYDELCEGRRHSESHFEDVLDDVDFYENYAATHPGFKNSRGKEAMDYIRETYHKVKTKGGFLTHE